MRINRFKPIENLFIDYFKQEADKISSDFKFVSCNAYTHFPVDENVGVGFFSMGLDCMLAEVDDDKTDAIALEIVAFDKENKLRVDVDICWGTPYGKTEAEIFEEPVEVTEESLAMIKEKLPGLVSKLRELIRDNPNGI